MIARLMSAPTGTAAVAMFASLLVAGVAYAHKVNVFAYVDGNELVAEGYFSRSVKAVNSPVTVGDDRGRTLASAETNDKGIARFSIPEFGPFTGDLTVVLETGEGHRAEYTVSAGDLPRGPSREADSKKPRSDAESAKPPSPEKAPTEASESLSGRPSAGPTDPAQLEALLKKELEPIRKKLTRLERLLLERQNAGPSFQEIVGGIGWIFGMAGIAALILSRRRRSD